MARKRFKRFARRASGFARRGVRRARGYVGGGDKLVQIDSMLYGAVRPMAANLIAPVANMLPLGGLSDEVGMGILNYFVAKNLRGFIGQVARKGLVVENAMVGGSLGANLLGGLGGGGQSTTISPTMLG